jgi:hypothetical protein
MCGLSAETREKILGRNTLTFLGDAGKELEHKLNRKRM